ncbi:MAG: helix-turn-helix transcriptional regulator [Bacteroidetes bacterium]|nr:helix-turn-helix transcriptional regulator [Bacteroidota bacterium]
MSEDRLALTIRSLEHMIARGWTAAAIAEQSGVNQLTVGNIKNGKASRITDKVFNKIAAFRLKVDAGTVLPPVRGRKPGRPAGAATAVPPIKGKTPQQGKSVPQPAQGKAKTPPRRSDGLSIKGMISTDYVPVDIAQLQALIDGLIARFAGAIEELEQIKRQLQP